MALLISKLPFGSLRTILAEVLNEELGKGNPNNSLPELYDKFLLSIGVAEADLEISDPFCIRNLWGIQQMLNSSSWSYGVGLCGVGAESLRRVYLKTMREYISQNAEIAAIKDQIEWKFWEIHTVEVDAQKQKAIRAAIDELVLANPELAPDLADGYRESLGAWERFWQQIFKAASANKIPQESVAQAPKKIRVAV
jgi:hypothetical protein